MIDELWNKTTTHPLVPGHEIIAEIDKVGANVKSFKPGDAVAFGVCRDCCGSCELCKTGADNLCDGCKYKFTYDPYLGGYSTFMQVKSSFVFHLPAGIPKSRAAPILCAGVTVFAPLKRWCIPGGRCGIIGIGGLGHMAIQYANKMGMKAVAISTSPAKEKEAKAFGAKEFVCSKNEEQMKYIQTKEKLDLVINTAYCHDVTNYMYTIKPGGRFIQVGLPETSSPVIFNTMDLVCNQKIFTGSCVGSRKEVEEVLDFSEKFEVYPTVENYPWAEMPKAYKRLHDGQAKYRCVVDVASTYDKN
jgi:D-arabinose 1-dehydrogenase-like Zn-dependent alcohol dehydrogenase